MTMMESSTRIFVKGLPPKFSEAELRKHFSQNGRAITDIKYFPDRRFGYVGFKTPEDAQAVVKYFHRTYVRMSRIGVELARPIEERTPPTARKGTGRDTDAPPITLKRKREGEAADKQDDPKLKEFLHAYKSKGKKKEAEDALMQDVGAEPAELTVEVPTAESDDEYEQVPKRAKHAKVDLPELDEAPVSAALPTAGGTEPESDEQIQQPAVEGAALVSDADWARSRTSRLLGLWDDEEDDEAAARHNASDDYDDEDITPKVSKPVAEEPTSSIPTPPADVPPDSEKEESAEQPVDADVEAVRKSMRLFVRNLPYDAREEDLETEFERFGNLEEVHIALDKKTGTAKGFAFIQYSDPDSAEQAFIDRDGQTFQGRLIHILPGTAKREDKLSDFDLSKLPLKKQNEIRRRREAASSTFNWNALYMNSDAVVSSVARRLGLAKSEVLDPTSSDAAVKQAHAETHIIQETKSYFRQHGVDLDSFKKSHRGDTAILVKNIAADCSKDELKRLFEEQGDVTKFLMPPAGTIAIVEFANPAQCKTAFGALAYRRVKSSMLFLEKAPKQLFTTKPVADDGGSQGVSKVSTADLKDADHTVPETSGTVTLFVRNLNFSTTTKVLTEAFTPLAGFLSARVKTREDPQRGTLSMGFGFAEFRTTKEAQAALETMDGYTLEGHKLQVRASHKGADAAEERRKADAAKRATARSTKIIIKNLPFETTKKDVRALFGAYGQLRSVRVPKKIDRAARGFAFADFTTSKEAQSAMDALRDTHLLGRRLVLDFAAEETEDAEAAIEKMQQKVGAQVNKVALQMLTSGGRKKSTISGGDEEVD